MRVKIRGRRWLQKTYGNTYHSCKVFVDDELVGHNPFTYGYDDHYIQTAHKLLQDSGHCPTTGERLKSGMDKDYYDFMMYRRDHRKDFDIEVVDVLRKKDL